MNEMKCPRRAEYSGVFKLPEYDEYREDDCCSYCGSLNPDTFMARLEAGDVELSATDKSYKVYVHNAGDTPLLPNKGCGYNAGGAPFLQSYREVSGGPLITREVSQVKFYFQHLSEAQMRRFVELFNQRKIRMSGGIGFYVLPFFMRPL